MDEASTCRQQQQTSMKALVVSSMYPYHRHRDQTVSTWCTSSGMRQIATANNSNGGDGDEVDDKEQHHNEEATHKNHALAHAHEEWVTAMRVCRCCGCGNGGDSALFKIHWMQAGWRWEWWSAMRVLSMWVPLLMVMLLLPAVVTVAFIPSSHPHDLRTSLSLSLLHLLHLSACFLFVSVVVYNIAIWSSACSVMSNKMKMAGVRNVVATRM
jgi:hypothetical protein